jgi:hypothetical protein
VQLPAFRPHPRLDLSRTTPLIARNPEETNLLKVAQSASLEYLCLFAYLLPTSCPPTYLPIRYLLLPSIRTPGSTRSQLSLSQTESINLLTSTPSRQKLLLQPKHFRARGSGFPFHIRPDSIVIELKHEKLYVPFTCCNTNTSRSISEQLVSDWKTAQPQPPTIT